jgi:hypothetical protein
VASGWREVIPFDPQAVGGGLAESQRSAAPKD